MNNQLHQTGIIRILIASIVFCSLTTQAQFNGGSSDGNSMSPLINTICTAPADGQAFFGGSGDGSGIGSLVSGTCNPQFLGVNYYGGNGGGGATGNVNVSNCAPLFTGVNYNGGNGDGYGAGSVNPSNCAPLFTGGNYFGGNSDGYARNDLQNSNCAPVLLGVNYLGGNADGFGVGRLAVSNCAPLFAGFNFMGGNGDGFSTNSIITGDLGKWLGITSTNWSVSTNWCGNAIPTPLTNVKISTGVPFQPTLTAASFCAGIDLGTGSNLTLNGQSLTITGAISGTGIMTGSPTSSLTFSGAGNAGTLRVNQNSASSKSLQNMTISKVGGTLTIADTLNMVNTITLSDGNLNTGNKLKLISSATNTARIAAVGATASITGSIVAERFAPGGNTGWANLGSPVTNAAITHWTSPWPTSGFPTSGFPGATGYAALGAPSMATYKENVAGNWDLGFIPPSSVNDPLLNGAGYNVFLGTTYTTTTDIKFKVTGTPFVGNKSYGITYTPSTAGVLHDGWNLIANPYPCEIDWLSGNWTKTNLDNAIYVYNADAGAYASFVGGVSTNGGSRFIASHQGFWVKANSASPVLSSTENVKVSTNPSFLRTAPVTEDFASMRIALMGMDTKLSDEIVIRFNQHATDEFDSELEAYKLPAITKDALGIMSVSDNVEYSVHALSSMDENTSIPVKLKVPGRGNYYLQFTELESIISNYADLFNSNHLVIEDLNDHKITPITGPMNYHFSHQSNDSTRHLLLRFREAETMSEAQKLESFDVLNVYQDQDAFYLNVGLTEEKRVNLEVFNILGQSVKNPMQMEMKQGTKRIDTAGLATGVYIIKVNAGNKQISKKVIIQ